MVAIAALPAVADAPGIAAMKGVATPEFVLAEAVPLPVALICSKL